MFVFRQEGAMGFNIAAALNNPKYRGIDTGMLLKAIEDRIDDYYMWCRRYECPHADFDSEVEEESEYEYFKGYGLALELARDILLVIHRTYRMKPNPLNG